MDSNERTPEHSRPIAEQVAERGMRMSDILGKTVEDVRKLGFDVSRCVPPGSVLTEAGPGPEDVGLEATGRRTGYVWRGFRSPTTDRPRLQLVPRPDSITEPLRVKFYPYTQRQ
jgi:hypothetical protein